MSDIPAGWLVQWPNKNAFMTSCGGVLHPFEGPGPLACTREERHEGPHVARSDPNNTRAMAVWWEGVDTSVEWPHYDDGPDCSDKDCEGSHDDAGWACTRQPGHDGPHVAYYSGGERCASTDPWGFPELEVPEEPKKGRRATTEELVKFWKDGHFPTETAFVEDGGCPVMYSGQRHDNPAVSVSKGRCCRMAGHKGPHTITGMSGEELRAIWEEN